ncbi:MAG: dienelactone hydrolase family protein [Cytophagales bacterium]|nr:MAG: dienelactone hydrolase family protein [Cytophagales bacterium]TAF59948.1 MAG: dienelactone hydrolase family protein [Cytophagales bacterium]
MKKTFKHLRTAALSVVVAAICSCWFVYHLSQPAFMPKAKSGTCCSVAEGKGMGQFSDDVEFQKAHLEPAKSHFKPQIGKKIQYKTPDGRKVSAFFCKAQKKSNRYIFVFHEWWGLNDHICKEAEKISQDLPDCNVLALDLYDEQVTDQREKAAEMMEGLIPERAFQVIDGAVAFAGKKAVIGTVGWCLGGGWSLQTALRHTTKVKASVIYYGMPEEDVNKLKALNAEVLGIFGSQDQWINPEMVKRFDNNMSLAGKKLTIKNYDAPHAFANPSNPKYNQLFAEDAYKAVLDLFKTKL